MKSILIILGLCANAIAQLPQSETEANLILDYLIKEHRLESPEIQRDDKSVLYKLGGKLFSDRRLSGNNNISCRTCHNPDFGSSDALALPIGEGGVGEGNARQLGEGKIIPRHSPHLFNLGSKFVNKLFWDGRVRYSFVHDVFQTPEPALNGFNPSAEHITKVLDSTLAAQALFPLVSHEEMRGEKGSNAIADAESNLEAWDLITQKLIDIEEYQKLFKSAYPNRREFNIGHVGKAIGHFIKNRFAVDNTPFDKYIRGKKEAMSFDQKKGAILFYTKGRCVTCHTGINFTDQGFHAVAFPQVGPGKDDQADDKGVYYRKLTEVSKYRFKTPGLRNLAYTAPYGHDGSLQTLEEVLALYVHPMRANHHYRSRHTNLPYELFVNTAQMNERLRVIDPVIGIRGISLTSQEQRLIIEFIRNALSEANYQSI